MSAHIDGDPFELTFEELLYRRAKISAQPGFVAFARIMGLRIVNGQSRSAFRMLSKIGAPAELAHRIIENWPVETADARLDSFGVELSEEATIRLAFFIDDLSRYDWAGVLSSALFGEGIQ